jgi:hypothetical protein
MSEVSENIGYNFERFLKRKFQELIETPSQVSPDFYNRE